MIRVAIIVLLIMIICFMFFYIMYVNKLIDEANRRLDDRNIIITKICSRYTIPVEEILELSSFKEDVNIDDN